MTRIRNTNNKSKSKSFFYEIKKNRILFLMLLPGLTVLIINNYLPMFGVILAFKDFRVRTGNFIVDLLTSKWVGFKNFEFFLNTDYAFTITRNTLLFNMVFIVLTLATAVPAAIALNELRNRRLAKFYQTAMFLPNFLSWVVVGFLAYAFLSTNMGMINQGILANLGIGPVNWYTEAKWWVLILPLVNIWKTLGYNTMVYFAGIANIDTEMYEASVVDGAGKLKQTIYITVPMTPLMITLTLLSIGRIFFADFGLFFQVTHNSGSLYPTTLVIDTYVYNALRVMGDTSMATAAGLYQGVVGCVMVFGSNLLVRRINKDYALF